MCVGPNLTILKICPTTVTLMILGSLVAAPENTMQLRGLIKGSNERSWHQLYFVFLLGITQ
jgi:hypothetical protein